MTCVVRGEVHKKFSWGNFIEGLLEDVGVDGIMVIKWTFKRWDGIMQRSDLTEDSC
jgi:hypothetical protein